MWICFHVGDQVHSLFFKPRFMFPAVHTPLFIFIIFQFGFATIHGFVGLCLWWLIILLRICTYLPDCLVVVLYLFGLIRITLLSFFFFIAFIKTGLNFMSQPFVLFILIHLVLYMAHNLHLIYLKKS